MTGRDPWAHRSARMRCRSCMWFAPKAVAGGATDIGRCRRHAPTMSGYPVAFVTDWCGDHKLNEEAVATPVDPVRPSDAPASDESLASHRFNVLRDALGQDVAKAREAWTRMGFKLPGGVDD